MFQYTKTLQKQLCPIYRSGLNPQCNYLVLYLQIFNHFNHLTKLVLNTLIFPQKIKYIRIILLFVLKFNLCTKLFNQNL